MTWKKIVYPYFSFVSKTHCHIMHYVLTAGADYKLRKAIDENQQVEVYEVYDFKSIVIQWYYYSQGRRLVWSRLLT